MFAASKTASVSGGYQISRSLRFNSADSAYLNRTPASATNQKTWTYSAWVKLSSLSGDQMIFSAGGSGALQCFFSGSNNTFNVFQSSYIYTTSQVFRDVSAWYHIVILVDTTQATSTERTKVYVNGVQATQASGTAYTQNANTSANAVTGHAIGAQSVVLGSYFNGYMTEINFIDGQALTPSSFGETNAQTGVWQPKAYSGSYGTNGFYLNFSDNSNTTAATLGKDYSGNGNNWTPNNFSVTAGAGNDSLVDSPTSYGTDTGVGGTVRGNYNTWNPLKNPQVAVLTNGNLDLSTAGSTARYGTYTTIGVSTGQWYWEITAGSLSTDGYNIGIVNASKPDTTALNADTNSYIYLDTGAKGYNGTGTAYGATYTAGDVIGVALDLDAGTLVFYKNGTSQGTAFTSIASNTWFPTVADNATGSTTGSSFIANFGQRPFAYTAPSGFKALCTQNLPTPTIGATATTLAGKFFDATTYTSNGTSQTITNSGFQPDFVWTKARSAISSNILVNSVVGASKYLRSNTTDSETTDANYLTSFNSSGFSVGSSNYGSGTTMVGWQWRANGSGSTNTSGSITSTVSANTTSGFSVVTYTGNGSNATVGHGLGVAPSMVIVKNRGSATAWQVYNQTLGRNKVIYLNLTNAPDTATNYWGTSDPSSTVFGISNDASLNSNGGTYVAYCFAEVAGYSKFGSYTGNGSTDGVFVYTGFRPAYVMVKCSSSGGTDWVIEDATRSATNVMDARLFANTSEAESSNGNGNIDFLSNGFKLRNAHASMNASGSTYIFAAFASAPQKFSLAR